MRVGDLDGAIEISGPLLDGMYESGGSIWCALTTKVLVEALLQRGALEISKTHNRRWTGWLHCRPILGLC